VSDIGGRPLGPPTADLARIVQAFNIPKAVNGPDLLPPGVVFF